MSAPRLGEFTGSGSFSVEQCIRVVHACGTGGQLHCLTHNAYGPVHDTPRAAHLDQCPIMAARLVSHHHWLEGVRAKVGHQQGQVSAASSARLREFAGETASEGTA